MKIIRLSTEPVFNDGKAILLSNVPYIPYCFSLYYFSGTQIDAYETIPANTPVVILALNYTKLKLIRRSELHPYMLRLG
jgi:hypothetical protein